MTTGQLMARGLPEIYKNGRGIKSDLQKLRKYRHESEGPQLGRRAYMAKVSLALNQCARAEKREHIKQWMDSKLHSLNPQKAASVQAIRDAWAKVQARKIEAVSNDQT